MRRAGYNLIRDRLLGGQKSQPNSRACLCCQLLPLHWRTNWQRLFQRCAPSAAPPDTRQTFDLQGVRAVAAHPTTLRPRSRAGPHDCFGFLTWLLAAPANQISRAAASQRGRRPSTCVPHAASVTITTKTQHTTPHDAPCVRSSRRCPTFLRGAPRWLPSPGKTGRGSLLPHLLALGWLGPRA